MTMPGGERTIHGGFKILVEEDDECDGNDVHLCTAEAEGSPNLGNEDPAETGVGGKVLPRPEPAELITKKAIMLTVSSWKGASGHAALHAHLEDVLSKDAGDESVAEQIKAAEAEFRQRRARLLLPLLRRRLSDLRFMWSWGLREAWVAMVHVGLFVLALASVPPVILLNFLLNFLNVFVSLLSGVPVVAYVMQVLVASPLAALTSRATFFCGEAAFVMHLKVHGDFGGDFNDMRWLLAHRDVEIAGLVSAVEALEKEAGDVGDGSESGVRSVGGRSAGVACCLVISLALPALLIAFAEFQPWGPPAGGIYCHGADDTFPSYPTLMIVVGALTLLCLCCVSCLGKTASSNRSDKLFFSFFMVFCCCGLPLLATAVMMWIYMAASPPECGIGMWVLGCVTLVTSVLACCGIFLTLKALGEMAPARNSSAVDEVEEKEAMELEEKLRGLWHRGGFRAKQAADQEKIKKNILDALLRTSTRDLEHEDTYRRFLHAIQHLVEQCRVLPMCNARVKYQKPDLGDFARGSCNAKLKKEALEWLSGVELLQEGYEHEDMERLLELFHVGTRQDEVLKSSELVSWREARHMAALDVAHEYFDNYNLQQLATGKCRQQHPLTVSRVQAEFLAAFVCLNAPGPVTIHLPAPVVPIVLAGRTDRRVGVLTDTATATAEVHSLLGEYSLNGCGSNDETEGQAMGLKVDAEGKLYLEGKMSVAGLRLLAAGVRWRYGRGASRAALLSWMRCQQEQDEPAGVAHALGEVWANASDGPSLAAVSDEQLQKWGVETADVRAEVLVRIHHRCHVPVNIADINLNDNAGLGSADGGKEAMRLLSELLPVLAPDLRYLRCSSCKLDDEGVLELAEVLPQLPHLQQLTAISNACTGSGARGLRRGWLAHLRRGWTYKAVKREGDLSLEDLPAMAAEGRTDTVVEMVQKRGANPNAANKYTGETALHAAARGGHTSTVEALLQTCGAKPELTDKRGLTALALACAEGHEVVAEKLVAPTHAAGALEVQGPSGYSALLFAEAQGLASVVDKMHECGVSWMSHGRPDLLLYLADVLVLTSVVDKLHECGVTAASRPDLLFFRGKLTCALRLVELNSILTCSFPFGRLSNFTDITLRSRQRCPMGSKGYYELEILEHDESWPWPQYGFASPSFQSRREYQADLQVNGKSSSPFGIFGNFPELVMTGRVGDDEHSWAVNGTSQMAKHNGALGRKPYECKWKTGDVVGLACDLDGMQILVSVNGSFAPPNGLVFKLDPHVVQRGLFAAFSSFTGRMGGELRYNLGQEPFKYAAPSSDYVGFFQFSDELGLAAAEGRTNTVVQMVQKSGVNPNAADKYTGETALHAAARGGHTTTVEALLQTCGAKPELTDKRGRTALALACAEGKWLVAEKLVAPTHAAGVLNVTDEYTGETALHTAARGGSMATVEALLQTCGAKPELTDKRGRTALALACSEGHEVVAEKLVAPTHAAGALEVQGPSGCSALLFAEAQGLASVVDKMHERGVSWMSHGRPDLLLYLADVLVLTSVVDKLHECGVTAASRPDLLFWRGKLTCALRLVELNGMVKRALPFENLSDGAEFTLRSRQRCPMGSKGYYELEILEHDESWLWPQYGFASSSFQTMREYQADFGKTSERLLRVEAERMGTEIGASPMVSSPVVSSELEKVFINVMSAYCPELVTNGRVGDDEHSWAVNGTSQMAKHNGFRGRKPYECKWKTGDVVGLACDLDGMQILVSVNGSFAPPNGLVFKLDPHVVQRGLFAAFSSFTGRRGGELRYNLGQEPFKYAAPSSDYVGFSQFADE